MVGLCLQADRSGKHDFNFACLLHNPNTLMQEDECSAPMCALWRCNVVLK